MSESVVYGGTSSARVRVHHLQQAKERGEKWAMLTAYDTYSAAIFEEAGIPVMLVGDSSGNVVLGYSSTVPVTVEDLLVMTKAVTRSTKRSLIVADMPFGTIGSRDEAYANAVTLMRAGAQMVKMEGGEWLADTVRFLVERSIPVCGHVGLTPQSVHAFGGFKVQGKTDAAAAQMRRDAIALQEAGAQLLVIEAVPTLLAREVTEQVAIPTIGIGAGIDCSGQVLVLHDMLGIFPGKRPRFVKDFMTGQPSIFAAVEAYVRAVKEGTFPGPEHTF